MSQRQAKLIRKAFRTCPLLVAMYGRLDSKNYKGIKQSKGKFNIVAPDKRRIYQYAKGLAIILLAILLPLTPMSTGQIHQARAQGPVDTLVPKIIYVESRGNPKAIGKKGEIGLMQIRWSIWKDILKKHDIAQRKDELLDPETNIRAGKFILALYLRKHNGNIEKALQSYSGGDRDYYKRVMEAPWTRN